MITMKELGAPIRQWVPDWLGLICIFIVILPVTMLNGSYTGSMLEVSNTLGTNTEDITMGYYAAAAGMAVSYPIIPKILDVIVKTCSDICFTIGQKNCQMFVAKLHKFHHPHNRMRFYPAHSVLSFPDFAVDTFLPQRFLR